MTDETLKIERRITRKLVTEILRRGHAVDVFDGEETTLKGSRKLEEILKALRTSDEDIVRFTSNSKSGWFYLIWGNGEDVISDYSYNTESEAIAAWVDDREPEEVETGR